MTESIEGIPVDTTSWLLCKEGRDLGIKTALRQHDFFRHFGCCFLTGNTAGAGSVLTLHPWGIPTGVLSQQILFLWLLRWKLFFIKIFRHYYQLLVFMPIASTEAVATLL